MNKTSLFFITIFGAILGSGITLFIITAIYGGDIKALIPNSPHLLSPDTKALSHVDKLRLERLIDKNIIFSADDLLGQIGTFYSTIIVFLIAIITVMSLFTLFFVKVSAEEKAEAQAKSVARQAINDKITPKFQQIDDHLNKFSESELSQKLDSLLQYKVLDSVVFWDKIQESIYSKSEEALEDYNIEAMSRDILKNSDEIESISSTIQHINLTLEDLNTDSEDGTVVIMDTEVSNGNSH
ncbi:conserved hypothetical protein [Vibrio crassostreae]|uniref:hypothetical protein n=1 Tax=Vibrio crassostreae TaxID=246167 RepID=UPI001B305482|nr:hypothetical protein [Vibrio crassostreae]CAK1941401.1 conserved hypothetical protein [Vibrio crassostreae]CAK1947491.1 conserved hypothetical protein [Vibrio crassostreae]CAK2013637.1 conserved hypothetical protein [Vibrio crassostreae]CAK2329348.1 conserved hypothetical protein [Vibrio crassostreae]CAK2329856.1 conserved hypothetical protein [Vibrio crassostreae]